MYPLFACASCWLALLGTFSLVVARSAAPTTTADLLVLIIVGTAAAGFSRIGLVSLLALALRLLPRGRLRARLASALLRAGPLLLRSSLLAAVSAGLVAQGVHATPHPGSEGVSVAAPAHTTAAAAHPPPSDPGWPTTPADDEPADDEPAPPADPAWPSGPPGGDPDEGDSPAGESDEGNSPGDESDEEDSPAGESDEEDSPSDGGDHEGSESRDGPAGHDGRTYTVRAGDCLWSIAAAHGEDGPATAARVRDIHADNRDVIGPDPNLIMPGQRLEIEP